MENSENKFLVRYWKRGKSTSARIFETFDYETYEEIIYGCILDIICNTVYKANYWYEMKNNNVFINRVSANNSICEYSIKLMDLRNFNKTKFEYCIEIECIYKNSYSEITLEIENEQGIRIKKDKVAKEKKLAKWLLEEKVSIKRFILDLYTYKSLKSLKENSSKATYYRHLKYCIEKGHIKNGKLTRKVWV